MNIADVVVSGEGALGGTRDLANGGSGASSSSVSNNNSRDLALGGGPSQESYQALRVQPCARVDNANGRWRVTATNMDPLLQPETGIVSSSQTARRVIDTLSAVGKRTYKKIKSGTAEAVSRYCEMVMAPESGVGQEPQPYGEPTHSLSLGHTAVRDLENEGLFVPVRQDYPKFYTRFGLLALAVLVLSQLLMLHSESLNITVVTLGNMIAAASGPAVHMCYTLSSGTLVLWALYLNPECPLRWSLLAVNCAMLVLSLWRGSETPEDDTTLALYYGPEVEAAPKTILDNPTGNVAEGNRLVRIMIGKRSGNTLIPTHDLHLGSGVVQTRMLEELTRPNVMSVSPVGQTYTTIMAGWTSKARVTNSFLHSHDLSGPSRTLQLLAIFQKTLYCPGSGGYMHSKYAFGLEAYQIPVFKKTDLGVSVAKEPATVSIKSAAMKSCTSEPMSYIPKMLALSPDLPKRPVMHMSGDRKGDKGSYLGVSNALSSLSRVMTKAPKIDGANLRLFGEFCAVFFPARLWAISAQSAPDMVRYIEESSYPGAVKARLLSIHQQICLIQSIEDLPARARAWDAFLKKERVSEGNKAARNICGISDYCRVLTLCCLAPFYPQIEQNFPEMCCGMTTDELYLHLVELFDVNGQFLEGDFSIFDSSQIRPITQHVDQLVIRLVFAEHPFFRDILLATYGANEMFISLGDSIRIWIETMRASGSAFTYLFNTFVNIAVSYFALAKSGAAVPLTANTSVRYVDGKFEVVELRTPVPMVAGGDDSLTQLTHMRTCAASNAGPAVSLDDVAAAYASLGFSMKFPTDDNNKLVTKSFSESAFLQRTFTTDGKCVADPIKRLVDFPYLWTEHEKRGGKNQAQYEKELLVAKALSALYNWPGCPILAPFFSRFVDKHGMMSKEVLAERHAALNDRFTHEQFLRQAETQNPIYLAPSQSQRHVMAEVFGIPVAVQLVAEKIEDYEELISYLAPYVPSEWVEYGKASPFMAMPAGEPTDSSDINAALNAPPGTETTVELKGTQTITKTTAVPPGQKDKPMCRDGASCQREARGQKCRFTHPDSAPGGAAPQTRGSKDVHTDSGSIPPVSNEKGESQSNEKAGAKPQRRSGRRPDAQQRSNKNVDKNKQNTKTKTSKNSEKPKQVKHQKREKQVKTTKTTNQFDLLNAASSTD